MTEAEKRRLVDAYKAGRLQGLIERDQRAPEQAPEPASECKRKHCTGYCRVKTTVQDVCFWILMVALVTGVCTLAYG